MAKAWKRAAQGREDRPSRSGSGKKVGRILTLKFKLGLFDRKPIDLAKAQGIGSAPGGDGPGPSTLKAAEGIDGAAQDTNTNCSDQTRASTKKIAVIGALAADLQLPRRLCRGALPQR